MTMASAVAPRAFAVWWKDVDKWDVLSIWLGTGFEVSHELCPLSEVMKVRWQQPTADELTGGSVSMVDRVSFDGEIFAGNKQETKMDQYVAQPGDLVVSKIRARQGSIGLVEPHHGPVSVTIHYRVLMTDTKRIDKHYAWLALRSSYCRAQFLAATGGAMKGEISEEALLAIKIPLPPPAEQKTIVARWRKAKDEIAAARQRVEKRKAGIDARFFADLGLRLPDTSSMPKAFAVWWEDFLRWGVRFNQLSQGGADITHGKYPIVELDSVLDLVQYGTSEKANSNGNGVPVLRIGNIKERSLDLADLKHIPLPKKTLDGLLLRNGDVLIIRTSGSRDLVGTCAVFRGEGDYVFASYLIRLRFSPDKVVPEFVSWFLNSSLGRQQVDAVSRQIMQNNINSEELRGLQIPLPPLPVQQQIMARVATGRAEIAREREAADKLTKDIHADIEVLILGTRTLDEN